MIKIKPNKRNTNKHTKEGMQLLEDSINEVGVIESVSVTKQGTIISGHARKEKFDKKGLKPKEVKLSPNEYPVIVRDDIDDETDTYYRAQILANTTAYKNFNLDVEEIEDIAEQYNIDIEEIGVEEMDVEGMDVEGIELEDDKDVVTSTKLKDKFIAPPFSILDTRQGYWQDRKKSWNSLINDNGETRDDIKSKVNAGVDAWENKPYKGGGVREKSISILDPVLSEIINMWFGFPECNSFDCFAGDSVFGYVSSYMGNSFTGIELREEQANVNNERISMYANSTYICDDGRNILNHIEEESQDLLFSCPPYFDLEVYSDLENDASNQDSYEDFISILDEAFSNAIKCLKNNRFAVIVLGNVRDKLGFYYPFIEDVKDIFYRNNLHLYNDMILIQAVGNGALRANRYMKNRKVVKMHENVLVFYKGDTSKIKEIFPHITDNYETADI